MSFDLVALIIRRYSGPAKLTLIALADLADETGLCWPSQDYIAKLAGGRDQRQIRRDIEALIGAGVLIKRTREPIHAGAFRSNEYTIDVSTIRALPEIATVGRTRPTDTDDPRTDKTATVGHTRPLTVGRECPPKQSGEQPTEPTSAGSSSGPPRSLKDLEEMGKRP